MKKYIPNPYRYPSANLVLQLWNTQALSILLRNFLAFSSKNNMFKINRFLIYLIELKNKEKLLKMYDFLWQKMYQKFPSFNQLYFFTLW